MKILSPFAVKINPEALEVEAFIDADPKPGVEDRVEIEFQGRRPEPDVVSISLSQARTLVAELTRLLATLPS